MVKEPLKVLISEDKSQVDKDKSELKGFVYGVLFWFMVALAIITAIADLIEEINCIKGL